MSRRQVRVEYSGSTELDIDEPLIVDGLSDNPTDDEIEEAIRADIDGFMDSGDPEPVNYAYVYDRDALIVSVRAEIERRKTAEAKP